MPVCVGRLRVELERTSEQTLRAVDVPAHVQQQDSEVDVRGDDRWVMLKAARVRLDRRFAVLPGIVELSEP